VRLGGAMMIAANVQRPTLNVQRSIQRVVEVLAAGSTASLVSVVGTTTATISRIRIMPLFLKYWLPILIWLGLIFIGSTDVLSAEQTSRFLVPFLRWLDPQISSATIVTIHFAVRKLGHLTEYAVLAMLLWRALRRGTNLQLNMLILFIAVLTACAILAASDEYHQSFVPSRTGSPNDVIIDICGAVVALVICWMFAGRRRQNLEL
jgi:VanZ family protein